MSKPGSPAVPWFGQIVLVAFAYAALGKLALMAAVPPAWAAAIFPPAGVALGAVLVGGYRLLPGVLLGAFLVNMAERGGALPYAPISVPLGIALGATAQAAWGAVLLRRMLKHDLWMLTERGLGRFALFGGVLGSLLSPLWATVVLYANGDVRPDNLVLNFLTWWVGDGIGVLLTAPLVLMLFAHPREYWRAQLRSVAIPLALTLMLAFFAFYQANGWERAAFTGQFRERADQHAAAMRAQIDRQLSDLTHLERYLAASDAVTPDEFREFTIHALASVPELGWMGWILPVTLEQRAAHEQAVRAQGVADYHIQDLHPEKLLVPAAERRKYFPLVHVEPRRAQPHVPGADMLSEATRREALERALYSGQLSISAPLFEESRTTLVMAFLPVIAQVHKRPGERSPGVVMAALHVDAGLTRALKTLAGAPLAVRLEDVTEEGAPRLLFDNGVTAVKWTPSAPLMTDWRYGGRIWRVTMAVSEEFLATQSVWQSWAVLVGGLVFTALFGGFILMLSIRHERVRQMVAERTRALTQSEARLASILDSTLEGIVLIDVQHRVRQCNPAFETLLGYAPGDLLNAPITPVLPVWPEMVANPGERAGHRRELQAHTRSGQVLAVEMAWRTLMLENEVFFLATLHDLTERYAADRMKREFVSVVSHELRTPLTSIRGSIALLASGSVAELPAPVRGLVNIALQNAERLSRLINDLLDLEKLEFGGFSLTMETLALHPLIERTLQENSVAAKARHVQLQFVPAPQADPHVDLSADRFAQVLNNLLSNAIKFSPEGGTVTVVTQMEGDQVRIMVSDQGEGIPEALHAHVFKKFWQADSSAGRQKGGTGLGLSITRSLVEKMNGRIGFTSAPEKGTQFWVQFPLV